MLEYLSRHIELEEGSDKLLQLPADFYSKTAAYARNLRRTYNSGNSEITNRLIERQSSMIQEMVGRIAKLRARKALAQRSLSQLLPEERHVCSLEDSFEQRLQEFIAAVSSGQSSFIEFAHRSEMNRMVVIRFIKPVSEVIGADLRRYGPFKPNDLASVPAANADILVANNEALVVRSRD
jgi:DNA replication factor GINS